MKGDEERCLAAGMDGYVAKPIQAEELFRSIELLFTGEEPAAPEAGPPEAREEPLNSEEALSRVGGDAELLAELAGILLEGLPGQLAAVRGANAGVVLSPLTINSRKPALDLPAKLAAEKIRFAFATDAPLRGGPESLRLSAALAVRNGCPRDRALAAITQEAAGLYNLENRVGSLRIGRDADWLVLSGDPVDLSSRIHSVHVAGREVWKAKESMQ